MSIIISQAEMLQRIQQNNLLDISSLRTEMETEKKEEFVKKHHSSKIFQGSDGRWKTNIKLENGRQKVVAKKKREDLVNYLFVYFGGRDEDYTIENLFPEWIEHKRKKGLSERTVVRYKTVWKSYYEGENITKKPIVDLRKLDVDEWLHQLIPRVNYLRQPFFSARLIIAQVLDYAVEREIIKVNPVTLVKIDKSRFKRKTKKKAELEIFTQKEVTEIFKLCDEKIEKPGRLRHLLVPYAVKFQFLTGLRVGEIAAVKYSDIQDGVLHLCRIWDYSNKKIIDHLKCGHESRDIVLTKQGLEVAEAAKAKQEELGIKSEYLFSVDSIPFNYQVYDNMYTWLCEKIGTEHKSSHKARKTYASALVNGGYGLEATRDILGHNDIRMTLNAYTFDATSNEARSEKLSNIVDIKKCN